MISPDVQRLAIADYCRTRGYDVVDWLEGIDQSGSRAKSAWWPRLDEAVGRVESREFDVIVVWKFSRTARNRLKWAIALDRVETAGGSIESATEQVDASTSTGRFTRGMLAELNAFEAERIGEIWREVHDSRLAAGKAPTGLPKYGYVWNKAEQLHEPDPVTSLILVEMYERFLAGATFYSLICWMNSNGIRTDAGSMWSANTLIRIMDSGFAAGFIPWHGQLHQGIHKPLIEPEIWQQYQDARASRRRIAPRTKATKYLLTGMAICGACGGPMQGNPQADKSAGSYRCGVSKTRGPDACSGTYVSVKLADAKIFEWLQSVAKDLDAEAELVGASRIKQVSAEAEARRLGQELQRLDNSMKRLSLQVAEGLVPEADYSATRDTLEAKYRVAKDRMEAQARIARETVKSPAATAARLVAEWDRLPLDQTRNILSTLLTRARLTSGGRESVKGRQGSLSLGMVEVLPSWSDTYVWL